MRLRRLTGARRKLSLTIVNRSYEAPEPVKIVLRDLVFGGSARVRTLTSGPECRSAGRPKCPAHKRRRRFRGT